MTSKNIENQGGFSPTRVTLSELFQILSTELTLSASMLVLSLAMRAQAQDRPVNMSDLTITSDGRVLLASDHEGYNGESSIYDYSVQDNMAGKILELPGSDVLKVEELPGLGLVYLACRDNGICDIYAPRVFEKDQPHEVSYDKLDLNLSNDVRPLFEKHKPRQTVVRDGMFKVRDGMLYFQVQYIDKKGQLSDKEWLALYVDKTGKPQLRMPMTSLHLTDDTIDFIVSRRTVLAYQTPDGVQFRVGLRKFVQGATGLKMGPDGPIALCEEGDRCYSVDAFLNKEELPDGASVWDVEDFGNVKLVELSWGDGHHEIYVLVNGQLIRISLASQA